MIPTTNQIKVYSLASKLNPQNTSNTKINVIIGSTGKNGTLNDGSGKSLPSRFLKRYIARDTNINATNVPAEISCAKNANGNIEPINTPIIVRLKVLCLVDVYGLILITKVVINHHDQMNIINVILLTSYQLKR